MSCGGNCGCNNQGSSLGLFNHGCCPQGDVFGQQIEAVMFRAPLQTAPDLVAIAGHDGLGAPADDLETVELARGQIAAINDMPTPPAGCGRRGNDALTLALCYQRAVLVAIGWLDSAAYERAGSVGAAAIRRLQAAIGVKVDGSWGPGTNDRLSTVVGVAMTSTAKPGGGGGASPAPPSPAPAPSPTNGAEPGGGGNGQAAAGNGGNGGGGLALLGLVAAGAAAVAMAQGS